MRLDKAGAIKVFTDVMSDNSNERPVARKPVMSLPPSVAN